MPVPFVTCKHEVTGAVADLPETGVKHFPGWVPIDQPEPEPTEAVTPAPATPEPAITTKRKAADTAAIEKE